MTLHLAAKPAKDGGGSTITGGVRFNDESGAGTGPYDQTHILIDSAQNEILGTTADAKSATTDTTPVSLTSVWKQISFSIQAAASSLAQLVTALGSTAFDLGPGTGGSRTLRVLVDSSETDGSAWETVAASQTDQAMGPTGATGDFLSGVLIVPATTSPGAVSIKDGAGSAITIFTGGATSVSNLAPIFVPLGMTSLAGAWKLTTGTNVSAIGVGRFT